MSRRWCGRLLVVAASALIVLRPVPASAHALLVTGDPGPGSVAPVATPVVRLFFTEELDGSLSRFSVAAGSGASLLSAAPTVAGRTAYLPVALRSGPVVVTWIAVGDDGHPVRGQFVFTAGTAGTAAAAADFSEGNAGSAGLGWLIKAGRFVEVTLLYLVLGALLVRVLVLRVGSAFPLLLVCGAGSLLLAPLLFAAYASRLHDTTGRTPAILSRVDLVWGAKLLLWLAFTTLVLRFGRSADRRRDLWLLALALLAALAFVANTHAAGRAPWWTGVMLLHVLVTALWAGGLAALLLVVLPGAGTERSQLVLVRFSRVMVLVVVGIVATGAALLLALAGSWQRAWCTGFGLTAGFKVSVVAVALLLGLVNNRIIAFTGRAGARAGHRLAVVHRVMAAEAALLLVVVALSAQLGETALPPAIKGALLPGDAQTSVSAGLVSSGCR